MRTALLATAAGLTILAGTAAPATAFWQRSQVSVCADATTEAERMRHRCWELNVYADPGWPALGIGVERGYGRSWHEFPGGRRQERGGVTRRLG